MSKYALMLFDTQLNLGYNKPIPNTWTNYKNVYFNNGKEALNAYINSNCIYAQLVQGEDEFELQCNMGQMILNFTNQNWINNNIYK